ncbi:MAG TPA: DUF4011 domain-containing protein, partial [Jiangellales bacterium]|nr:DUF4011 domain-containing protein [Jiangellales bacterium]
MSEESAGGAVTSRADRAAAAAEGWAEQLAGLGGRSTLLHFRDLKTGTLDLAAADAEARRRLVEGHPTPVSRLFPHEPLRSSATRSARAVRDKARELADERGLQTCFLAVGIATWSDPFAARRPTAPVLLRPARLAQVGGAGSDLLVTVSTEAQVNPVLLRSMADQLGLRIEPDDLLDAAGELRYTTVVEKLREFAPPHVVDGFSVAHRAVLGTFSNAAVSLRDDLLGAAGQLASHDVVSAVAGDESALAALRHRESRSAHGVRELLVVDADAGQEAAVRGAAAGDAVLLGTPGTGMTQTLVNLVATVVGQGRRVLVVAARRDDASALVRRLDHLGLGGPVLDGDERRPRAELVADLGGLLRPVATGDHPRTGARAAVSLASREPDLEAATDAVSARRDSLAAHRDTMHRPREPWGISAYAAQAAVAGAAEAVRCAARLDGTAVRQLHGERRSAARAALREFTDLGGLALGPDDSPWYGSTPTGPAAARETADRVVRLRDRGLPELRDVATRAAVEVGLPGPATPAEAVGTVRLLDRAAALLRTFGPELWAADLDALVAATADRAWRREHGSSLGWLTRRRLRVEADALLRPHGGARPGGDRSGRADLHGR